MKSTFLFLFLFSSFSQAAIEAYEFNDNIEQEETYKGLVQELRCLVCQNNNLADSNADLAQDLRKETYDLVIQGKSRDDVVDYMVARYGDFVVYNPPLKSSTFFLWFGPFILLVLVLWLLIKRYKKPTLADQATSSNASKAKQLLDE